MPEELPETAQAVEAGYLPELWDRYLEKLEREHGLPPGHLRKIALTKNVHINELNPLGLSTKEGPMARFGSIPEARKAIETHVKSLIKTPPEAQTDQLPASAMRAEQPPSGAALIDPITAEEMRAEHDKANASSEDPEEAFKTAMGNIHTTHAQRLQPHDLRVARRINPDTGSDRLVGAYLVPGDPVNEQMLGPLDQEHRDKLPWISGKILEGKPFSYLYGSAAQRHVGSRPTAQRRREEYSVSSAGERIAGQTPTQEQLITMIPEQLVATKPGLNKEPAVLLEGYGGDEVLNNAEHLWEAAKASGTKVAYQPDDPHFAADFVHYIQNQRHGYRGDGSGPVLDESGKPNRLWEKDQQSPQPYVPHILTKEQAEFIHACLNVSEGKKKVTESGAPSFAQHAEWLRRINAAYAGQQANENRLMAELSRKMPDVDKFKFNKQTNDWENTGKKVPWREGTLEATWRAHRVELMRHGEPGAESMRKSNFPAAEVIPQAPHYRHTTAEFKPTGISQDPLIGAPLGGGEKITHAAVRHGSGKIYLGRNHFEAHQNAYDAGELYTLDAPETGFLTNYGRYLDREEAATLARQSRQLSERGMRREPEIEEAFGRQPPSQRAAPRELWSEDLKPLSKAEGRPPTPMDYNPIIGAPLGAGDEPPNFQTASPEDFIAARDKSKRPQYLSPLKPEDIQQHQLYMNPEGTIGVAVSPEGDIQNVFNNGGPKGHGAYAVAHAITQGGTHLDAYDPYLPEFYRQFGFKETGRMKFNRDYAPPKWDFENDDDPDIAFMGWEGYPEGGREAAIARARHKLPKLLNERASNYSDEWDQQKAASRAHYRRARANRMVGKGPQGEAHREGNPSSTATGSSPGQSVIPPSEGEVGSYAPMPAPISSDPAVGMPLAGPRAFGFKQAKQEGRTFKNPEIGGGERFEIDDRDMKMKPATGRSAGMYKNALHQAYTEKPVAGLYLDQAIDHPELFRNYPFLRGYTIRFDPNIKEGGYHRAGFEDAGGNTFGGEVVTKDHKNKNTIVHEIQHAIQYYEKWSGRGENLDSILENLQNDPAVSRDLTKEWDARNPTPAKYMDQYKRRQREAFAENRMRDMAYAIYRNNPGEIEARVAGKRAEYPKEEEIPSVLRQKPEHQFRNLQQEIWREIENTRQWGREAGIMSKWIHPAEKEYHAARNRENQYHAQYSGTPQFDPAEADRLEQERIAATNRMTSLPAPSEGEVGSYEKPMPAPISSDPDVGMPLGGPKALGYGRAQEKGRVFHTTLHTKEVAPTERFEISDKNLKFAKAPKGSTAKTMLEHHYQQGTLPIKLDKAIVHPELFRNYPQLSDIEVTMDPTLPPELGGAYAPPGIDQQTGQHLAPQLFIRTPQDPDVKGSIAHEIQHGVQFIEGFPGGIPPAEIHDRLFNDHGIRQVIMAEFHHLFGPRGTQSQFLNYAQQRLEEFRQHIYLRDRGEIEARVVGQRAQPGGHTTWKVVEPQLTEPATAPESLAQERAMVEKYFPIENWQQYTGHMPEESLYPHPPNAGPPAPPPSEGEVGSYAPEPNWFGKSKVVDSQGKPQVVYHGTNRAFNTFSHDASNTGARSGALAYWFTSHPDEAEQYGITGRTGRVNEISEQMRNLEKDAQDLNLPYEKLQQLNDHYLALEKEREEIFNNARQSGDVLVAGQGANIFPAHLSIQNPKEIDMGGKMRPGEGELPKLITEAKAKGHDGLILRNSYDPMWNEEKPPYGNTDLFAAFHPHQIRSSISQLPSEGEVGSYEKRFEPGPAVPDALKEEKSDQGEMLPKSYGRIEFQSPQIGLSKTHNAAKLALGQEPHHNFRAFADKVDREISSRLGHEPGSNSDVIGTAPEGSYNGLVTRVNVDPEQDLQGRRLAQALKGLHGAAREVSSFTVHPEGPHKLYSLAFNNDDPEAVAALLRQHGIDEHSLEGQKNSRAPVWAHFVDEEGEHSKALEKLIKSGVVREGHESYGTHEIQGDSYSRERAAERFAQTVQGIRDSLYPGRGQGAEASPSGVQPSPEGAWIDQLLGEATQNWRGIRQTKEYKDQEKDEDKRLAAIDRAKIPASLKAERKRIREVAQKFVADNPNLPERSAHRFIYGQDTFPEGVKGNEAKGVFFDQRNSRLDYANPEHRSIAAEALTHDIMHALANGSSAYGWYDLNVKKAMEKFSEIAPELKTNKRAMRAFKLAMAVTSQGQNVFANAESAWHVYQYWKTHDEFPIDPALFGTGYIGGGTKHPAMIKNFAKLNKLKDDLKSERKLDDALHSEFTPAQMQEKFGYRPGGEAADELLPGSSMLGPKVGIFFQNLHGNFKPTTMDLWFSRTLNRIAGNMFGFSPNALRKDRGSGESEDNKAQLTKLHEMITDGSLKHASPEEQEKMKAEIAALHSAGPGLTREEAIRLAPTIGAWADKAHNTFIKSEGLKGSYNPALATRENLTGKNIDLNLHGLSDDPRGIPERKQWREVIKEVDSNLRKHGIEINNADKQALLWYLEQQLFQGEDASSSEDYLTAAHHLVRRVKARDL